MRRYVLLLVAVLVAAGLAAPAPGRASHWIERGEWIPTADPLVEMHADVVRDGSFGWDEPQPVILVATPYGNHSGQSGWSFRTETTHNDRFDDFLSRSNALAQGYTYVMVDLPGYGGSSGCSDLGGPKERAAVSTAVEWAARQPWSTGKVALLGKSYDGWTGLMGVADQPEGLAAVVSLEPVYSPYTVDVSHGVRNSRSLVLPAIYAEIDAQPGTINDRPRYQANSIPRPNCFAWTQAHWYNDNEDAAFWRERDLPKDSVGSPVPLLLTQGLLETNTVSRGSLDYFNSLGHPGNRVWLGQFDHIRAWDEYESGRSGFIDETMRFLDLHLKGISPTVADPAVEVQDSLGRYRAEASYPPLDSTGFTTSLSPGIYVDDSAQLSGIQNFSGALDHAVWMAGEPAVRLTVRAAVPRANLAVRVFDVDQYGFAVKVTTDAYLLRHRGEQTVEFKLKPQDWVFPAGHRIVVEVGAPGEEFVSVPTATPVVVQAAEVTLPFLTTGRTQFLSGSSTPALSDWRYQQRAYLGYGEMKQVHFSLPDPIDIGPLSGS